jgi:hypothetical protein
MHEFIARFSGRQANETVKVRLRAQAAKAVGDGRGLVSYLATVVRICLWEGEGWKSMGERNWSFGIVSLYASQGVFVGDN